MVIVAALAVVAVGVLVVVRVADSGDQGTTPAPHIQVVDGSAKSGQDPGTSGASATPTHGEVRSRGSVDVGSSGRESHGPSGLPRGDSGAVRSSGSADVGSSGGDSNGPAGLPGDGGELPGG